MTRDPFDLENIEELEDYIRTEYVSELGASTAANLFSILQEELEEGKTERVTPEYIEEVLVSDRYWS